jgi:hypothetical protein
MTSPLLPVVALTFGAAAMCGIARYAEGSGAGPWQARQGRADDAERHRIRIATVLSITPFHRLAYSMVGAAGFERAATRVQSADAPATPHPVDTKNPPPPGRLV